ncbi:MAG TPA: steroid delta-isomerase, partial [Gordonia polyisoprenivorans]|nr:steroid delta-isomerase [Gordonia polyisoprenivorans]
VMTFDDDGAITSMRAYWSPQDIVITERTAGTSPKRKDGHHDH